MNRELADFSDKIEETFDCMNFHITGFLSAILRFFC